MVRTNEWRWWSTNLEILSVGGSYEAMIGLPGFPRLEGGIIWQVLSGLRRSISRRLHIDGFLIAHLYKKEVDLPGALGGWVFLQWAVVGGVL